MGMNVFQNIHFNAIPFLIKSQIPSKYFAIRACVNLLGLDFRQLNKFRKFDS